MTALLTDNLPLLAGAPNGIKKLRELILELAVRGKLVPQEPSDEPASELLKRIAEEKARLVAEGKIKKQKPLPGVSEEEQLFELPSGWEWVRLGAIQTFTNGYAFKSHDFQDTGVGVVRIGDVRREGFISTDGMVRFPEKKLSQIDSRYVVEPGDLVISMTGDVKLAFNRSNERFLLNQRVGKISIHLASKQYICLLLVTQAQEKIEQASGSVISNVSTEEINNSVISLPPLTEQHRIVAKVDELMALCDRLEAQQTDAESAHAQLVQALLDSLTQASDAEDFAQSWQRLAEHFHTLFTTESSIDALKQTLLQLAVMGKLVPQDPSDEPASELLKRIAEEKARLVAEGKLKKQKTLPKVSEEERPFELPQAWMWCRLQDAFDVRDGTHDTPKYQQSGYPLVTSKNLYTGRLDLGDVKFISEEDHQKISARSKVDRGDILFAMIGSIGNPAIVDTDIPFSIKNVALIKQYSPILMSEHYLLLYLLVAAADLREKSAGGVQSFVSLGSIRLYPFAFPPLPEQHRIVAKVDQLMGLCDQLKTRLTQARQLNEQLASTLVEQAVA